MEWLERWLKRIRFRLFDKPKIKHDLAKLPGETVQAKLTLSNKAYDVIEYWALEQLTRYPEDFPQETEEGKLARAKGIVLQKALALYDASAREVLQGKRIGSAKLLSSLETEFIGLP